MHMYNTLANHQLLSRFLSDIINEIHLGIYSSFKDAAYLNLTLRNVANNHKKYSIF